MARTIQTAGVLAVALLVLGGCGGKEARKPGQVVYLVEAEYPAVYEASLAAMRENFPIESADAESGEILGRPILYSGDDPEDRFSTGLTQTRSELRRKAYMVVSERPEGPAVEVRVDIERRDTQDYQVYEGVLAAEDLRQRTPAERRDMANPEQRDVWTFVRRDQKMEDLLLRQVRERLGLIGPTGGAVGGMNPVELTEEWGLESEPGSGV